MTIVKVQLFHSSFQESVILNSIDWIVPEAREIDPFKVLKRGLADYSDVILLKIQFVEFQSYLGEAVLYHFYSIVGQVKCF